MNSTNSIDSTEDLLEKLTINHKQEPLSNGNIHVQHNQIHKSLSISYESYPQAHNQPSQAQLRHTDSKNLNIKLNNINNKIPNQITINDNKHIYVNDDDNNNNMMMMSIDLENRQAFPLKSTPSTNTNNTSISSNSIINCSKNDSAVSKKTTTKSSSLSSTNSIQHNTTSISTIVNNINDEFSNINKSIDTDNNNNQNYVNNNNQPGVPITTQVPPSRYTYQNSSNNNNNNNNKIFTHDTNKPKFIPIIDTDGVKYKFKSDETIGGKSDLSINERSTKFRCLKCLNCSIM